MIKDADHAQFDRVIAVSLRSVFACMKYEVRQLLVQGGRGAIVNIFSINGMRPQPRCPAYTAAKHGVIGLTKCASLQYAANGIRANCVLPGAIETAMMLDAAADRDAPLDNFAHAISLFRRLGQPSEVAQANLWLCSNASSFVTGHSLAVDAGYTSR
jgi:NAD(P)-dependent dehydrogenase (short-subunit alcohol dehydrogenase family)